MGGVKRHFISISLSFKKINLCVRRVLVEIICERKIILQNICADVMWILIDISKFSNSRDIF